MSQGSLGFNEDDEDDVNAMPNAAEDRASTSLESPGHELAAEENPVEDSARSADAIPQTPAPDDSAPSEASSPNLTGSSPNLMTGQDDSAKAEYDAPITPAPAQSSPARTPQPKRQLGVIPGIEEPVIPHAMLNEPGLEAQAEAEGQQEAGRQMQQRALAQRQQVAQINGSDPYQSDDGRWKVQRVDPQGAINEHDILDSGMGKVDRKTGAIFVQTSNGPVQIGVDAPTQLTAQLSQQRGQLYAQRSQQEADIQQSQHNLAAATQTLKSFNGVPENLQREIDKYTAVAAVGDADDPNKAKAQAKLAAAQAELDKWKSTDAGQQWAFAKKTQADLQAGIQQKQSDLEETKSNISQNLANRAYVQFAGTMPPAPDNAPGDNSDVTMRNLTQRAGELAAKSALPPGMATVAALIEAKNSGYATVGGIPIDRQIANAGVDKLIPQMTAPQLMAANKAGVISQNQMRDAFKANLAAKDAAAATADNGVDPVSDFVTRLGAKNAEMLNRAAEGVSRLVSGDSEATGFFKANAEGMQALGQGQFGSVNPARNNTVSAGIARGMGAFVSTLPVATATTLALPEALGAGAVGLLAKGAGMAAGALPLAMQFGSSAFAEAYDAEMSKSGDKQAATNAGTTAAAHTFYALPLYGVAGAFGGKVARSLMPEIVSPLRAAATHFFTNGVANSVASAALRAASGEPIIPTAEGAAQDWAFAGQHALTEYGGQAQKNAFFGVAQDILAGTDPQIRQYDAIAKNATDPGLKAKAQQWADNARKNASDFLSKAKIPVNVPGSKSDPLAQSMVDLHDKVTDARAKLETVQTSGAENSAGALEHQALSDAEDKLLDAHQEMMARVPDDLQARISKVAAPDVDWQATKARTADNPIGHFATHEIGETMKDTYVPPDRQQAIRAMARANGIDPDTAEHIVHQAVGAKAIKDLQGVLTHQPIGESKTELFKALGLLVPKDAGDPASPLHVTEDAQHLFPPGVQNAVVKQAPKLRISNAPDDQHGSMVYQLAKAGMEHASARAAKLLPKSAEAAPGDSTGQPAAAAPVAPPDNRPIKPFAAEVYSRTLKDGKPAPGSLTKHTMDVQARDEAEAQSIAEKQVADGGRFPLPAKTKIRAKAEQKAEPAPDQPIQFASKTPEERAAKLKKNNAEAAAFSAANPEIRTAVMKQAALFAQKYGKIFKSAFSTESVDAGGLAFDAEKNTLLVSHNDLMNTAERVYEGARKAGADEQAAREQVAKAVNVKLDEELRHVADTKANTDAQTADLWRALPDEVKDAARRAYSFDNPNGNFAGLSDTAWGREFKRLLSQSQNGEVSELAELTKQHAEAALKSGNGGWVRAVMDSIKRMADWLKGNAGSETARQLDALHAELAKIEAEAAMPDEKAPESPAPPEGESIVPHLPIVEVPVGKLTLSKDVPQFKSNADAKGVVEPLAGKFDRTGVGPIQVWERTNGDMEVISGRHRLDLAQRSNEQTIPAQIHREADGFTKHQASMLDAELNIRDDQGSVADYANYFRNSAETKEAAESKGLLGRGKGQAGFSIGKGAGESLYGLHQAGGISDAKARAIAEAAPGDDGAQALGLKVAKGNSAEMIGNIMKAAKMRAGERAQAGDQGDLFGFDDSAIRQMEAQAKVASREQADIREQISAVKGAASKPEVARKMGVNVKDPEGVKKRIASLNEELARWENWPMHPDLVERTRANEPPAEDEKVAASRREIIPGIENPLAASRGESDDERMPENERAASDSGHPSPSGQMEEDYRIDHRPNPDGPRAFDLAEGGLMPDDVYDHPDWYSGQGKGSASLRETVAALRKIRGKPEAEVTIYRAAPKNELRNGDWVSLSKSYAKQHGMADDPSADVPVHSFTVKAKDLRWPGDELGEFGYFPENPDSRASGIDALHASRRDTGTPDLFAGAPQKLDEDALKDAPPRAQNLAAAWSKLTAKMTKGEALTPGEQAAYRLAEKELGQKYLFDAPAAKPQEDTKAAAASEIARRKALKLTGKPLESQADIFTGKPEADKNGQGALFASRNERDETPSERLARAVPPGTKIHEVGNAAISEAGNILMASRPAYHGTPHEVDKFDTSKIGTGEGAQVYGHGLYFAENPEVADIYRKTLSSKADNLARYVKDRTGIPLADGAIRTALEFTGKYEGQPEIAARRAKYASSDLRALSDDEVHKVAEAARGAIEGNTYTVALKPDEEEFLDWDKPLSEQSEKVKAALMKTPWGKNWMSDRPNTPFSELYQDMAHNEMDAKEASKVFQEAGARGIRYLDQGSRPKGDPDTIRGNILKAKESLKRWQDSPPENRGAAIAREQVEMFKREIATLEKNLSDALANPPTHNYVIFDANDIEITHKNGEPVALKDVPSRAAGDVGAQALHASRNERPADDDARHLATIREAAPEAGDAEAARDAIVSKLAERPRQIMESQLEGHSPEEMAARLGMTREQAKAAGENMTKAVAFKMQDAGVPPDDIVNALFSSRPEWAYDNLEHDAVTLSNRERIPMEEARQKIKDMNLERRKEFYSVPKQDRAYTSILGSSSARRTFGSGSRPRASEAIDRTGQPSPIDPRFLRIIPEDPATMTPERREQYEKHLREADDLRKLLYGRQSKTLQSGQVLRQAGETPRAETEAGAVLREPAGQKEGALAASRPPDEAPQNAFVAEAKKEAGKNLTREQRDVYDAMRGGANKQEIAAKLGMSPADVSRHLAEAGAMIEKAGQDAIKIATDPIKQVASGAVDKLADRVKSFAQSNGKGLTAYRALTAGGKLGINYGKEQHAFIEDQKAQIAKQVGEMIDELPRENQAAFRERLQKLTTESVKINATGNNESQLARMYRDGQKLAARVMDKAQDLHKSDVLDAIKDAASRIADSPGVDVQYKGWAKKLISNLDFSRPREDTVSGLKGTADFIARKDAAMEPHSVPQQVVSDLDRLQKIVARDLPTHILESTLGDLQLLEKLGRLKVRSREAVRDARFLNEQAALEKAGTTPLNLTPVKRAQPTEKLSVMDKLKNRVIAAQNKALILDKALLPMGAIADYMGRGKGTYDGWLENHVHGRVDGAFNELLKDKESLLGGFREIVGKNKLGLQDGERFAVHATLQQEGGEKRLLEQGVSKRIIDEVKANGLKGPLAEMYQQWKGIEQWIYPRVSKVAREEFNQAVKKVENYFPMLRDHEAYTPDPQPVEVEGGKTIQYDPQAVLRGLVQDFSPMNKTKTEGGFMKERVANAQTPIRLDGFHVVERHVQDALHFIHMQPELNRIARLVNDNQFREKYGDLGQRIYQGFVDTVARQGGVDASRRLQWLDTLRRNTSLGAIAFRIASQFKHLSNIPFAIFHVGPGEYSKAMTQIFRPEVQDWFKQHMAETIERAGGEYSISELKSIPGEKMGFVIARQIDRLNAQATALAGYMGEMKKAGLDSDSFLTAPVNRQHVNKALVLMRRAVASPLSKDLPQALTRGAGVGDNASVGKTIFQFQSIFLDQWSNLRHDLIRAGITEGNPMKAAAMGATLGAVLLMETGIVYGFKGAVNAVTGHKDDKKESFKKTLLMDAVKRFPFAGQVLNSILYHGTGVPLIDAIVEPAKEAGKAVMDKRPESRNKALVKSATGAGTLLGIPGIGQAGEIIHKLLPDAKKGR